jgi:hypothetical protein
LVDSAAARRLKRYGLTLQSFFDVSEPPADKIARRVMPEALRARGDKVASAVADEIDSWRADLERYDPTLAAALSKSRAKILHQIEKVERKTAREAMRRDLAATRAEASLRGLMYPEKHLQERLYSIVPFLAKHGPTLPARLYENVRLDCPDHIVLEIPG